MVLEEKMGEKDSSRAHSQGIDQDVFSKACIPSASGMGVDNIIFFQHKVKCQKFYIGIAIV